MIQKQKKTKKVTFSLSDLSWEPTKIITPLFCLVLDKKDRVVRAFEVTNKEGEKMNWDEVKKKGSTHYKISSTEPIDLIKDFGMLRGFALGNIIKYACRSKPGDLDKIIHYAQMLIVVEEENKNAEKTKRELLDMSTKGHRVGTKPDSRRS